MIYDNKYISDKIKLKDQEFSANDDEIKTKANTDTDFSNLLLDSLSDLRNGIGESMKTDKICFFMANGCSIYAGSNSIASGNVCTDELLDEFNLIEKDILKVKKASFEEQMNQLNVIKDYYQLFNEKEKLEQIGRYIEFKKKQLLNYFVYGLDYTKLTVHEIFMIKLRSFNAINKCNFFTPNYDLALEYTLDKIQEVYNNGFVGFINRKFDISSFNSFHPNIVKIHGSLNWILDDSTNELKEIQPLFKDGKIETDSLGKSIIYPSSQKLIQTYDLPYSELLRYMLNTIQTGKNVIFVLGYKYGDSHINDVLLKGITNPNNIFYFFDFDNCKTNDFINKIKILEQTLNNINIIQGHFLADFSIFVNYLMPSNDEKTDHEKIFGLLQKVLNDGKN